MAGALPVGETSSSSAAPRARSWQGAGKELAGWLPSGPWLLPTVRLLQTVVGSARLEEDDLNSSSFWFYFVGLLCVFSFGDSEWAGPWARHSYLCWHLFNTRNPAAPATE